MPTAAALPPMGIRYMPARAATSDRWRDRVAGVLMVIGLAWPFLFSSVIAVPWWAFVPCALLAGVLRYRKYPRETMPQAPMLLFCLIVVIYTLFAYTLMPMPAYGSEKAWRFALLAGTAYLVTVRMAPLTDDLARGMRWAMVVSTVLALGVTYLNRDMFLHTQKYGMQEMRMLFAVTGFPLSVALVTLWIIPRTLRPLPIFLGGGLLLLAAALEIFIRGRFAAITLAGMAVLLVLGPPWKHLLARVALSVLLVGVFLGAYWVILPNFGDSYQYLEGLLKHPMENRDILFTIAWRGFMAHPMGLGIGAFAETGMMDYYPHNVFLEVGYELGLPGLLAVAVIYAVAIRRAWQLWLSPPHRLFAAMLVVVLLYMLKAGDIATWAFQWVYLYMLVVATPVAPTWPLLRGEAVA